jgi:hypothetical protein
MFPCKEKLDGSLFGWVRDINTCSTNTSLFQAVGEQRHAYYLEMGMPM